jgi:hypothetical protein
MKRCGWLSGMGNKVATIDTLLSNAGHTITTQGAGMDSLIIFTGIFDHLRGEYRITGKPYGPRWIWRS